MVRVAALTAFLVGLWDITSISKLVCAGQHNPAYLDSSLPPKERAADLLQRMTWEEKVGQLGGVRRTLGRTNGQATLNKTAFDIAHKTQNGQIGLGAQYNYAKDVLPVVNELRAEQINSTRLGIPYVVITDSINSVWVSGGTLFPGAISMASSWNLDLYERVIAAIRDENHALGVNWVLSPELDIAYDPRNGRNGEMFGEDTYLISQFGTKHVQTMQAKDDNGFVKIATTVKHWVYGRGNGGVNRASMSGGINHIMNDLAAPYIKVIKEAEPLSLMVSYASVDRVPMSINRHMIQDILRYNLGFEGLVMSDASSIQYTTTESKVAKSREDAALKALRAGLEHELSPDGAGLYTTLINEFNNTEIANLIDKSVLALLVIKFATGVFDNSLPSVEKMANTLRNEDHLEINRNISRESVVLLKNDGILPLQRNNIGKIAVVGAYADMINAGMYAACNATDPAYGDSLRRSLSKELGDENVLYAHGVDALPSNDSSGIDAAMAVAREAGFAVVVLGSGYGTFDATEINNRRTDGEGFAHAELGFPGLQQQLLDAVLDTGVPTILVMSGGQTFVLNESTMRSAAIIHSWLSGEFTGDALVEILFGDTNPSGKLTVTMPQANGAFPAAYDYLPSDDQGGFGTATLYDWQWPQVARYAPLRFGFGLSYTTFNISSPVTPSAVSYGGDVSVSVSVKNTGKVAGKEVVQLYYRPEYSVIEFPVMKLVRFVKIDLAPGESKDIKLVVPHNELGYYIDGIWNVDSGNYTFWIGSSSRTEDLHRFNVTIS
ncbi:glycoside hydrolase family 3 protein [Annulohypoxylon maeteangense]|uniref:glycoside hydrolase family 3 protein n=1 Tax=Annulohypoxylon maeteangense TaxID=1927788 RepID=UPI002007AB13|nr:glycoside hydrolase family 3 protein [Annulohypoxylon maeteangense]KAI0882348.1 glycoside hydrolase family 3 protein [Annulohypoxylon maeteangense]